MTLDIFDTGAVDVEFIVALDLEVMAKLEAAASFTIDSLSNGNCSETSDGMSETSPMVLCQMGSKLPRMDEYLKS